jgi:hypothetical protein
MVGRDDLEHRSEAVPLVGRELPPSLDGRPDGGQGAEPAVVQVEDGGGRLERADLFQNLAGAVGQLGGGRGPFGVGGVQDLVDESVGRCTGSDKAATTSGRSWSSGTSYLPVGGWTPARASAWLRPRQSKVSKWARHGAWSSHRQPVPMYGPQDRRERASRSPASTSGGEGR